MTECSGVKVLVVEDEGLVAMMIERMLEDLGCEVVASVAHISKAMVVAGEADIDLALLDVNVAGAPVFPIADILRARGIPFIFSTGYGASGLPREFSGHQVMSKPFCEDELRQKMALMLVAVE
jgi:CheY-like chemotaxis protein